MGTAIDEKDMELLLDTSLLICVMVVGGLTELFMRRSPEAITKRRYAIACVLVLSSLSVLAEGLTKGIVWSVIPYRILIVAALTTLGYSMIKTIVLGWIKK